ncbi:helix-turn-helix domain-containing protein [Rosistilla oblonga]|uniref:helix-turn-helix domain-containing protein n=1 Tax=Rosistilla oblonga TaxID=2527990 RepID=UPI003A976C11
MLDGIGVEHEFNQSVAREIQSRELVTSLIVLRHRAELTQAELAEKMGCTQSAISKLESSDDDSLRIGDLKSYLSAVDAQSHISLLPKSFKLADQVKYHCCRVNDLIHELATLTDRDEKLGLGVSQFFGEAFCNMFRFFESAQARIQSVKRASFSVSIVEVSDSPESQDEASESTQTETDSGQVPCGEAT